MTTENFADHANVEPTTPPPSEPSDSRIVVGERTFNSAEELVNSWKHSQEHIKTLEQENAEYREQVAKAKGLEDVIKKLDEKNLAPQENKTSSNDADSAQNFLTKDELDELLAQREQNSIAENNARQAMAKAKEVLGDGFIEKLQSTASELGMTEQEALDIAKRSPSAFGKLFLPNSTQVSARPSSDINSSAIKPKQEQATARVRVGAPTSELVSAWSAAAPKLEE